MPITGTASPSVGTGPTASPGGLRCRVRLADGRTFSGELPSVRHRALQLGMLHADSDGLVELAAGRRRDGHLQISTRQRPDHFLSGGRKGDGDWLEALLALAERHTARREEVFIAPAVRRAPRGDKDAVARTRSLWIDVDQAGQLPALWAFLARRPCHLLVESGGSGGAHAYWKLDRPLPAAEVIEATGELVEPIERAHLRLIHHLGTDPQGKPNVADTACKDRSRVMRLAGTVNGKTGRYARILEADFRLPAYPIDELVGDLPDPTPAVSGGGARARRTVDHRDPYKRISPPEYFEKLAGIDVARGGLVSCPAPWHEDRHPSCSVGTDANAGWCCFAGETRVLTRDGAKAIHELAGTTPTILTRTGHWAQAPFRSFGNQQLQRIVLTRNTREKEILATAEHRWFVRMPQSKYGRHRTVTTSELRRGDRLVSVFPQNTPRRHRLTVSPFGVARGFTFGDGHRCRQGCRASFYGTKDQALLPFFPVSEPYFHKPTGSLVVGGLPGYFKDIPSIDELPSYLYGWLAGYFAADGDVGASDASLNCADGHVLEQVRAICTRIGIGTYGISRYERAGIDGKTSAIYRLRLIRSDLTPQFFVLPHHRAAIESRQPRYERRDWIVRNVEATDRREEVFCAVVPDTHAFALEDNILTGNCHAASCGVRGAIYDLASVLLGGPHGHELRGEAFKRARAYVADIFGDPT